MDPSPPTRRRRRRSRYNVVPRWLSPRRFIALVVLLVVGVCGVFGARVVFGLASITHESVSEVIGDLIHGKNDSAVQTNVTNLQRINIALYGYGGDGHDGAYLTDSIMIVSIQPVASGPPRVAEISIPRDWWVPITTDSGVQPQRVNEAFQWGVDGDGPLPASNDLAGGTLADNTLEKLLGIHIDYWVGVDFEAFKDAVNDVGGINVDVPDTFTDYQYPAGECDGEDPNCGYITVHFNQGEQHMDGATALEFARSRHSNDNGEGSDFARSRRQQLILLALKQAIVSVGGIGKLPGLLDSLGQNVVTNLKVSDMESLYDLTSSVNTNAVLHISIDDQNLLYDCGYPTNCDAAVLFAYDTSYAEMKHYIANVFVPTAALTEKARVNFIDATGDGYATDAFRPDRSWASMFNQLGLKASGVGVTTAQTATEVVGPATGAGSQTAAWLAAYFGVAVTSPTAAHLPDLGSAVPVTVVLGSAEAAQFNHGIGNGY